VYIVLLYSISQITIPGRTYHELLDLVPLTHHVQIVLARSYLSLPEIQWP